MYQLHELLRAFAAHHGEMLNYSAVSRTLGTTRLASGRHFKNLRSEGFVRLLPALPEPCPHDLIRRPRLYLRAAAWKHTFAPTPRAAACRRVPVHDRLLSRVVDAVMERETSRRRPSRFYAMGRYRRRGVDLVVVRPSGWRLGLCVEPDCEGRMCRKALEALLEALACGWIDSAILLTGRGFPGFVRGQLRLPVPLFLAMYGLWSSEMVSKEQMAALLYWLDGEFLVALGGFSDPEQPLRLDGQYDPLEEPLLPRPP